MLMKHKHSVEEIEVHPSQIESAKNNGWTEAKPKRPKPPQTEKSEDKE